ncbi:hypothetical protein [Croceiramulus getboli]|nr:hypothetical protein P8624_10090 [Flavobacteriaceae bacterium YJPT1-3]
MDFEKFFKELKKDMATLVADRFSQEKEDVKNEVTLFLEQSKDKLKRWAQLLADGLLSPEEFELLLKSQKDLLVLASLHKAGVSKIKIGHFKNAAIKLVVGKAVSFLI